MLRHPIRQAEQEYTTLLLPDGRTLDATGEPAALRCAALHVEGARGLPLPEKARRGELHPEAIEAYVNEARWIVECPFCSSAQVGSPNDPRFLCVTCLNAAVGGALLPVVYPPPQQRAAIVDLIQVRPHRTNVNWRPHEALEVLKAQNVAHGDPA